MTDLLEICNYLYSKIKTEPETSIESFALAELLTSGRFEKLFDFISKDEVTP